MNETPPKSEAKFFSSFVLMLFALAVTFGVLFMYAPSKRFRIEDGISIDKPAQLADNGQGNQTVEMRHFAPDSFSPDSSNNAGSSRRYESEELIGAENKLAQQNEPQKSDKDVERMLSEAMNLVDTGNPQAAMALLEKILAKDGNNEMALVEMGMIHLIDLKDPQSALGFLERALKVNPGNKVVLSELVGIYDELGQSDVGLSYLQGLYDENPDNPSLAMGIGQVLATQGRLQDALPYLEKAAEDGQSEMALTDLADAYSQVGQSGKALETYRKVAEVAEEKLESGFFANDPEMGKEAVARAYMDVIGELVNQNREQEAREVMEKKIKKLFNGDLGEFANLLERNRPPSPPPPALR